MGYKCSKEKQIEKIEAMSEKNNDCIIEMRSDIGYIKEGIDVIKNNHLSHLSQDLTHLKDNYIVFKTRIMVGWGFAITVVSILINKLIEKVL